MPALPAQALEEELLRVGNAGVQAAIGVLGRGGTLQAASAAAAAAAKVNTCTGPEMHATTKQPVVHEVPSSLLSAPLSPADMINQESVACYSNIMDTCNMCGIHV
jgi:hypothetical protein